MDVFWLEQCVADLPEHYDWLSSHDMARLHGMRFEKRRVDWQLGRWTAKRALAAYWNVPAHPESLARIEIRPAASGAPEVFIAGEPTGVTISLSHRAGIAICAVANSGALGCDLEIVEPRSDAFVADYFTTEEQEFVAQVPATDRSQWLAVLWSAKESALKAMRIGLRMDTRSLSVDLLVRAAGIDNPYGNDPALPWQLPYTSTGWHPLQVRCGASLLFQGWWQQAHNLLRTMVAVPAPSQPISLQEAGLCRSPAASLSASHIAKKKGGTTAVAL